MNPLNDWVHALSTLVATLAAPKTLVRTENRTGVFTVARSLCLYACRWKCGFSHVFWSLNSIVIYKKCVFASMRMSFQIWGGYRIGNFWRPFACRYSAWQPFPSVSSLQLAECFWSDVANISIPMNETSLACLAIPHDDRIATVQTTGIHFLVGVPSGIYPTGIKQISK